MSFEELHKNYTRPEQICGIYSIQNVLNNKQYIGKSTDIYKRWQQHCSKSSWNKEPNKPLYRAMQKDGLDNFKLIILEKCTRDQLGLYEKYWISKLNTQNKDFGYNITAGGDSDGFMGGNNHPNHKLTIDDIIDIRTRYANHERKYKVEELYKDKIGPSGFAKIWQGITWSDIMPEIYTPENISFHKQNVGCVGSKNGRAILNEFMVLDIRTRRKNGEQWETVYDTYYKNIGLKKSTFQQVWMGYEWPQIKV